MMRKMFEEIVIIYAFDYLDVQETFHLCFKGL